MGERRNRYIRNVRKPSANINTDFENLNITYMRYESSNSFVINYIHDLHAYEERLGQ